MYAIIICSPVLYMALTTWLLNEHPLVVVFLLKNVWLATASAFFLKINK